MSGTKWSEEQVEYLRANFASRTAAWIGKKLGKSQPSVLQKAALIGLRKSRRRNWWQGAFVNFLRARLAEGLLFSAFHSHGDTSLIVTVIRVGGEGKRTATVRLADGSKITAIVSGREHTEMLGKMLYQRLEVSGRAVWSSRDGRILSLRITGVGPYFEKDSNPIEALSSLADLSGGCWDTVDPDAYIRDLLSDEV